MKPFKLVFIAIISLALVQCESDDDDQIMTPISDFQFLVDGATVTFNGTVSEDTQSFIWDFGDGNTSSDPDPVHAYGVGEFEVTLTATSEKGSFTETKTVTILPSLEILLTGGPAKPEGKSWRMKKDLTVGIEGAGFIENDLGIFQGSIPDLFDQVGLGASYEDTFTFVHDGQYKVDNKNGQSLMGVVYASVKVPGDIREVSWDPNNVPLANVIYTPKADATWQISEEDFTILALSDTGVNPVNFTGKTRLILDEYLGFKDQQIIVILKDISETSMNIAFGIATEGAYLDYPTIFLHLSLEAI